MTDSLLRILGGAAICYCASWIVRLAVRAELSRDNGLAKAQADNEHHRDLYREEGRKNLDLQDQVAKLEEALGCAVEKSQQRLCDLVKAETRLASAELSLRNHAPGIYKAHLEWCERELATPKPTRFCSEVDETDPGGQA